MGSLGIVVEQVLLQFVLQLGNGLEGGSLQQVLVEGSPEPLYLPVGLGPVGPGVAVLDAQLLEHPFHGVAVGVVGGGHLGAVVGEEGVEADAVLGVEEVDGLECGEHDAQALDVTDDLGPGQPSAGIEEGYQVVAAFGVQQEVPAEVVGVEVAQLSGASLDDLALGALHLFGEPVDAVAPGDGINGGRLRGVVFEDRLEYGIYLVAIGAIEAFVEDLVLYEGESATALPPGASLAREEGLVGWGEEEAIVVLGEGLARGAMEGVEVLERNGSGDASWP